MKLKLRQLFYPVFILAVLLSSEMRSYAQARIVIGNSSAVYMNISSGVLATPIYLVVDNPATNAIDYSNGGAKVSWIITEGQYNRVKWNMGATNGTYLLPFGYSAGAGSDNYIPYKFVKTAGTANISFSTWASNPANVPWANTSSVAAVTNMYSAAKGYDVSIASVIDRWWDTNPSAAGVQADVSYTYRGFENTMTVTPTGPGFIAMQHWTGTGWNNGKSGTNGTFTSTGVAGNQGAGTFTVTATGLTEWSPQVLVAEAAPLPVTWLDVSATCNSGDVTVKWSTASEQNSDYFTVERSYDGANFTDLANVLAAGQSSTVKNYSFVDEDPIPGVSYYRIRETDFNSSWMHSDQMTVNGCSNDDIFIFGSEGGVSVNINATETSEYKFELYDLLGRNLMNEAKTVSEGENHLKLSVSNIASAMYVVKVYSSSNMISKKVFIRSAYTQ